MRGATISVVDADAGSEAGVSSQIFVLAGLWSSVVGLVVAGVLWFFFLFGAISHVSGRATMAAATASLVWLFALTSAFAFAEQLHWTLPIARVLEVVTYAMWQGVLLRALGVSPRNLRSAADRPRFRLLWGTLGVSGLSLLASATSSGLWLLRDVEVPTLELAELVATGFRLQMAILGLLLVEQVLRNTRYDHHWNIKYLVLGLGVVFGYAFVMYADALLFQRISPAFLAVHGAVFAAAAPFLVLGTLRNRERRLHFNVSRRLVIRTGTFTITGAYLLLAGTVALWLRAAGGDWGDFLAVLFTLIAVSVGVALAASTRMRRRMSAWLVRNLYQRKHDYGERWLRVTQTLLTPDEDASLGDRAVRAMKEIIGAHRGALWKLSDADVLIPAAQLQCGWNMPFSAAETRALRDAFEEDGAPLILDGQDVAKDPLRDRLAAAMATLEDAHVVIPLFLPDRFYGIVVLSGPVTGEAVEWEDEELLALAARQIASFLAHNDAQRTLAYNRQLDAFNQMTAFVVHDLKTVVAQLSLMTRNAEKHRHKPGFVDDMISTSAHACDRMQALLAHLRDQRETVSAGVEELSLHAVAELVLDRQRLVKPEPTLITCNSDIRVRANVDQLTAAIGHLVQNAQEVSGENGNVRVVVGEDGEWNMIRIEDDGPGMEADFIAGRLFRPFASTKGLSGMGVGAWQSREYVRLIGGDIQVESLPGRGSVFTVLLPPSDGATPSREETVRVSASAG